MRRFIFTIICVVSVWTVSAQNRLDEVLRNVEVNNKELQAKFDAYQLPTKEFINFDAVNGTNLYGWIIKPANFDANKEYPLVMVQYSGPDSQEALDRFKPDWEYYLVQEG